MRCRQRQRAALGLACSQSIFRHLDAVIHAIAHQMRQRVGNLLYQALVQLGGLAQRDEVNLLAHLARQIAQHAREAAEYGRHGNHANRHHRFLQITRVAIQIRQPSQ